MLRKATRRAHTQVRASSLEVSTVTQLRGGKGARVRALATDPIAAAISEVTTAPGQLECVLFDCTRSDTFAESFHGGTAL